MSDEYVTYVCRTCGSEDVSQDAWADWNPATSQMELRSSFDDSHCHQCEESTKTDELKITDPVRIKSLNRKRLKHRAEGLAPLLLQATKNLKNQLEAWVEIADEEDLRDEDTQAIEAAEALIAKIESPA